MTDPIATKERTPMFRRLELPRNVMRLSNKGLTKEQLAAEAEIRRKTAQKLYSSSESDDG